jgi:hypothetical protein
MVVVLAALALSSSGWCIARDESGDDDVASRAQPVPVQQLHAGSQCIGSAQPAGLSRAAARTHAAACTLLPQSSKSAPNVVGEWSNTKSATEKAMKLMQMYKDLGDYEQQVRPGCVCGGGVKTAATAEGKVDTAGGVQQLQPQP